MCALFFFTAACIFFGNVEPHFSLIFNPFGLTPIETTFAPSDFSNCGPDLYPAPLAQSITIFKPFKLKFFGKFFLRILRYFSFPFSSLLTLPRLLGL